MEEKRCNAFENALWHDIRASSCCICSIKCSNHEKQSHQQREKMCMINWKHHINYCLSLLLLMQNPKKTRIQFELGSVSRILMYSLLLSDYSSLFLTFSTYSDTDYIAFHLLPFLGMFEINHTQNASDITFFLGELCRFRRKWKIWRKKTDHMLLITLYAEPSKYSVGTFCERIEECVAMPRRRVKCRIIDMKFVCVCWAHNVFTFYRKKGTKWLDDQRNIYDLWTWCVNVCLFCNVTPNPAI